MTWYTLLPLLGFILELTLAFLALSRDRRSRLHRVFFVFLVSMSLWSLSIFGMRSSPDLGTALLWERPVLASFPLIALSFFRFTLLFSGAKVETRTVVGMYLLTLAVMSLAFTDLVVAGMQLKFYGYAPVLGRLFFPYVLYAYVTFFLGLFRLIPVYRHAPSADDRNRAAYLIAGMLGLFLGLTTDYLPSLGVHNYPLGILGGIWFALAAQVAVLKYHLLDVHVVIRKGLPYTLVSLLAIGTYLLVLFTVNRLAEARELPLAAEILLVLVVAIAFQPALSYVQRRVDRWFYRERYDYLRALENFSRRPKAITDLPVIAESLTTMAASALRCRSAAVLLPDSEGNNFISMASRGNVDYSSVRLAKDSTLVRWLSRGEDFLTRENVNVVPQLQSLSARERETLDKLQAELLVPLMTNEGLRGILVLGRKLSDQDYPPEELSVLRVVARHVAITLDNARLYELQKRRYLEQSLLAKLGMIVSSELDLNKVFDLFINELRVVMPVDCAFMTLIDDRGQHSLTNVMTSLSGLNMPGDFLSKMPTGGTGAAWVATHQEIHYQPNLADGKEFWNDDRLLDAGVKSVVRLPLMLKQEIIGTLMLGSIHQDAFGGDDLKLLLQVANQLAIAAQNSRLFNSERQARLELEKLNKERIDLINALIHEIKTPLTAMLASAELLKEELSPGSSPLGALAENLDVATHNLDRRISELRNFTLLQTTEMLPHVQTIDIHEPAQHTAAEVTALLEKRGQTLNLELPDSLPPVEADADRLVQIFLNLLTNASKYSPPGSKISLQAHKDGDYVILEVLDCAPCIEPEEAEVIFNPYHRSKKTAAAGGLGLGLSICRRLVELHGGKIWVENGTAGNIFKFSLRIARSPSIDDSEVKHEGIAN